MKCLKCKGEGKVWIVNRVVQGQDYGPSEEGHYEKCGNCSGTGEVSDSGAEEISDSGTSEASGSI